MTKRRVLVTGASRGIGRAIAIELAGAGCAVTIGYRSNEAAAQEALGAVEAAGGSGMLLACDVAQADETRRLLEEDVQANGAYWGVVLNAGVTADGPFASMKPEAWRSVLGTNLDGFYNVMQPLIMPMVRMRDGGRVVTISSVAGLHGNRGQVNYAASKAGLVGATKSLALEVAKRGITVNCVAPGFIETDLVADLPIEELAESIPLKRFGKPEEIAGLVGYLFSEAGAYVTGQVFSVDGGMGC